MKGLYCLFLAIFAVTATLAQNVNFSWAKQMAGTIGNASSLKVDAAGNVYTTGSFRGTVDFDPGPGVFNLTAVNRNNDMFISKLDAAGNFIWAKQIAGAGITDVGGNETVDVVTSFSLALDASGNIYTTGAFFGNVDFDPGPGTVNIESLGTYRSGFILKLDAAGNFVWAEQIGGKQNISTNGLTVVADAAGNVYTSGQFLGTVDFDPGPGIFSLTSGFATAFISKFDAAGNFVWAKAPVLSAGSLGFIGAYIALDPAGNIYCTGGFKGLVDFDPGAGVYSLNAASDSWNIYVWKLNNDGGFVWAKVLGGAGFATGNSIAVDPSGNVYTSGYFNSTADFDPGPDVYLLNTGSFNDSRMFVSKLNAGGDFVWARQTDSVACGESISLGTSMALDAEGNIFTTGTFINTVDFDPGLGTHDLTSAGSNDIFVSKLTPEGNFIWVKQMGGIGIDNSAAVEVDLTGNVYTIGTFQKTVDFDPGPGIFNLTSAGQYNIFIQKMSKCVNSTASTLTVAVCGDYTLNGQTYKNSGDYTQNIANTSGCDSLIRLHLTINRIRAEKYVTSCGDFTWKCKTVMPDCKNIVQQCVTYTTSGDYTDTISTPGACDSIITLHLTITEPLYSTLSQTVCEGHDIRGHNSSGVYTDTLAAPGYCANIVTMNLSVNPSSFSSFSQTICDGDLFLGHGTSGIFSDTLKAANGCDSIRSLQLTVKPKPSPDLSAFKELCYGDSLILFPGQFSNYLWQDGSSGPTITIKKEGLYAVEVTNDCGTTKEEVQIESRLCGAFFPTAFTPNHDGKNDVFKMLGANNLSSFHLSVFNRWGQKVFETRDFTRAWTGESQDTGAYIWFCSFKKPGNPQSFEMKGSVLLIR